MENKKKILLLTLGTGSGMISEDGEAGYLSTQYMIEGKPYQKNGVEVKTNFVAEPIIDYFIPDEIFILGTITSNWYQFYASTITQDNNDKSYLDNKNYQRLLKIKQENGIHTSSEKLEEYGAEITEIFEQIPSWEKYSTSYRKNKPGIHILLTKYGINEEELKENYHILKKIESFLEMDMMYEVAFDITHSFRSLPIYNLIIFNYIRNITKYHISIKNVYYGMFEVKREMGDRVPIVDLIDVVNVLNLTNGVAEFKDTGNAVSLLQLLKEEDSVRDALEKFDLATQINAFDKIREELLNLCELTKSQAKEGRFTGVREMIATVLGDRFLDGHDMDIDSLSNMPVADLKFQLTKWFFNQNRMGLGLATGLEALRDIVTPAFMDARNFPPADERKYRENAESFFILIADRMSKSTSIVDSNLNKVVRNLGIRLRHYKDIRNVFAHSLSRTDSSGLDNIRADINQFKNDLFALKKLYDYNKADFCKLFIPAQIASTKQNSTNKNCRLVINFAGPCDYNNYKRATTGAIYDVYYMNNAVRKKLFKGIIQKKYPSTERAYFMYRYLIKKIQEDIPADYEKISIVFVGCPSSDIEVVYKAFLENMQIEDREIELLSKTDKGVTKCKKLRLHLSMEAYEDDFAGKVAEYAEIMDLPLIKLN